jgi:hypothetical protein
MIKPPFTAKSGLSGTWIEDAEGVTVWNINSLLGLSNEQMFDLAMLFAKGANERLRVLEHVSRIAKKAGRPMLKKPSASTLAKRKSRAKLTQEKPE